ncbi:hypothetical protein ABZW59_36715 [Nocardia aurea]
MAAVMVHMVNTALEAPHELRATYPELNEPSWSDRELARRAILETLAGRMLGMNPYLVLLDWRENADDIHQRLRYVPSRPAMSWDQSPGPADGPAQYPNDADEFLREVARQSREAGLALLRLTQGDSYQLGFIPSERAQLLLADAAIAGFTEDNGYVFDIIKG